MNQIPNYAAQNPQHEFLVGQAIDMMVKGIHPNDPLRDFYLGMVTSNRSAHMEEIRTKCEHALASANAVAKAFRANTRAKKFPNARELVAKGMLSKANLDVGTLTNFANITGGQSLGYVSLDTQLARGTVRPNSFTLYQALHKSAAFQVIDYWAYASDTGGGLPGTAFTGFSNVSSGTLATSAGKYQLQYITLRLAVNGRAVTTALAAQNSFVDIGAQENINAALTVLESMNWGAYWGNNTFYANQFNGIAATVPSGNIFDFGVYFATYGSGLSKAQAAFNLIYQSAAQITSYNKFGRITHAFMSPTCAGSLQQLVTTLLNNIVDFPRDAALSGIVVDGDLQGMKTRFGEIQFPIDLYITARDKPAQAILQGDGTNFATTVSPTPPVSLVAATISASATTSSGSQWTSDYVAVSGIYSYAVASTDAAMNESYLTFLSSGSGSGSVLAVSGVAASGAIRLTIVGPVANDATNFRLYRSGLGYQPATSGVANAASYRYIATVASGTTVFYDLNTYVPGSETLFLLDMDDNDNAIDFRFLLPLTKIELFAQNLYMPWAVAEIGSLRLRIAKFHGYIRNYVPDNPNFSPLQPNANAT